MSNIDVSYCPRVAFVILLQVNNANPNGDPLQGNMPRTTMDGYGKMTAVCIKRKIRDRLQEMGQPIYIVSDSRADDGYKSINSRIADNPAIAEAIKQRDKDAVSSALLDSYIDARAFGGVIAGFKSKKGDGLSIGIRGAVSICDAISVCPVMITEDQITKSVNQEGDTGEMSSDRFGTRYTVDHGLYVIKGTVNPYFAERNRFTKEDWENVRQALINLCDNDESSARPAGSMAVRKAIFWHGDMTNNGISRLFDSVKISVKEDVSLPASYSDYDVTIDSLDGITPEVIDI